MAIVLNPFTGQLDFTGSGSGASPYFGNPVATPSNLPASGSDGELRVVKSTDDIYIYDGVRLVWVNTGITNTQYSSTPNTLPITLGEINNITYIDNVLTAHPADATHPGVVSTITQTFAGTKTFSDIAVTGDTTVTGKIYSNGGVDITTVGGTLAIGTSNATTINIGQSGATINLIGSTINQNVTNLNVKDKNITVNSGGATGSASNSGIEIEENAVITGYIETSSDRNSFIIKAPAQTGVVTVSPGASGFTLSQGSHDPVTLTAVGSTPNANGASLSTQALTLQPADGTNPGLLTAGTQTIGGAKTLSSLVTASVGLSVVGTTTLDTGLSGPLRATSGVVSTGQTSLISEVTGILPIVNGGTNSNTVLNNNRSVVTLGGKIIEAAAQTNGQLLIGSTSTAPVVANITGSGGITVTNGAGTIALSLTTPPTTGDISATVYTSTTNIPTNETMTGFSFSNAVTRSFSAQISVVINATTNLYANYRLEAIQRGADWTYTEEYVGDNTGYSFSITTAGQVQVSKTVSNTGYTSTKFSFRATTLGV